MAKANGAVTKRILATKTAHLPVPLTPAELAAVAEQMGRVEGDLRAFYARKKEVTADLKAKEEALDAEMGKLWRLQRDKHEYRPVAVRVEADFRAGKVFEVREDTGEVIGERAVNEQDRQASIFDAPRKGSVEDQVAGVVEHLGIRSEKPLEWHEEGERVLGVAGDGIVYAVEPYLDGYRWTQGRKKSGPLTATGGRSAKALAMEDAERAELERKGDGILKNAGGGELAAKDLKGEAVARKRGGRRA